MSNTANANPVATKIIIIEDSTLVRKGLVAIVNNLPRPGLFQDLADASETPYRVIADVSNPKELFAVLAEQQPDLLLVDYSLNMVSDDDHPLHMLDGQRLIKYLRKHYQLKLIVVSVHHAPIIIRGSLEAGAHGFVSKAANEDTLGLAIEIVMKGGTFVEHALLRNVLHRHPDRPPISAREFEVLRQMGKGTRLTDIAVNMHLSIKTVSAHKLRAMEKLGVHNECELYQVIASMVR